MNTTARIDRWIWILIYGGIVVIGLGLTMLSGDAAPGWPALLLGAALVLVGLLLIWLRSRIKDTPPAPPKEKTP